MSSFQSHWASLWFLTPLVDPRFLKCPCLLLCSSGSTLLFLSECPLSPGSLCFWPAALLVGLPRTRSSPSGFLVLHPFSGVTISSYWSNCLLSPPDPEAHISDPSFSPELLPPGLGSSLSAWPPCLVVYPLTAIKLLTVFQTQHFSSCLLDTSSWTPLPRTAHRYSSSVHPNMISSSFPQTCVSFCILFISTADLTTHPNGTARNREVIFTHLSSASMTSHQFPFVSSPSSIAPSSGSITSLFKISSSFAPHASHIQTPPQPPKWVIQNINLTPFTPIPTHGLRPLNSYHCLQVKVQAYSMSPSPTKAPFGLLLTAISASKLQFSFPCILPSNSISLPKVSQTHCVLSLYIFSGRLLCLEGTSSPALSSHDSDQVSSGDLSLSCESDQML